MDGQKSREFMWHMPAAVQAVWYALAAASIVVFLYGVARPLARYRHADRAGLPPLAELPGRIRSATATVFSHRTIGRRDALVGWAHRGIFYGWVALAIGTVLVALQHDLTDPLFGWRYLTGDFYLFFKAALNLLGTGLVLGLLAMMVRRAVVKPDEPRSSRSRAGDWVFTVSLLVIAVTGYVLEGVRLAMDGPGFELYQFGGWLFAEAFRAAAIGPDGLGDIRHGLWWFHGLLAITFVASIPYTKAAHMLSSYASLVLRDDRAGKRLRPIPPQRAAQPAGYGVLADVSALHLLHLDACTSCGRCHDVCPARAVGKPLSPRDVILDLREQARAATGAGVEGVLGALLSAGRDAPLAAAAVSGAVGPETAWSCMQCNACVEVCPVGIEQAPIINQIRRRLVEDGELEPGLRGTLQVIQKSGNSLGENRKRRGRWTRDLDFAIKDARQEPVDVLWFVGDYASFDPRAQEVTKTVARLFAEAGLDFGLLYDGERNAGNDVRRVGEEGLFESLAQHNIAQISECAFARIVTTDPHSLNALRNEYPALGGDWPVLHHTELLLELITLGRLRVAPLGRRVTYHDPCYLGRHNGVYDDPRALLEAIGCELVEMPRNRDNSFCCGAGGGRIWMADTPGQERPSEGRIREALAIPEPPELFVVACPKDVVMYEDAIKTTGSSERLALRELSELIAEAVLLAESPRLSAATTSAEGDRR